MNKTNNSLHESTLLGDQEVEARFRVKYRGHTPKKMIPGNLNYYDHNILGLSNRNGTQKVDHDGTTVFESTDTLKRNRSQPNVTLFLTISQIRGQVADKITETKSLLPTKTVESSKSTSNLHLHHYLANLNPRAEKDKIRSQQRSKVNMKQKGFDVSYELYRKNRGILDTIHKDSVNDVPDDNFSKKAEVPDINLKERSKSLCAGCYNRRAMVGKEQEKEQENITEKEKGQKMRSKWDEENEKALQIQKEKKLKELRSLTESTNKATGEEGVTPKITEHGSKTGRETVDDDRGRGSKTARATNGLDLPSYRQKKGTKDEYRRTLLDQIEQDRKKRLEKKAANCQPFNGGLFVDKSKTKNKPIKAQEYQNAILSDKERKSVSLIFLPLCRLQR